MSPDMHSPEVDNGGNMGSVHDRRHLLTHDDQAVDCLGQPEVTSDASLIAKRGAIISSPMGCCHSDFRPIRMFCLGWGGTLRTVSSEEKCVFTEKQRCRQDANKRQRTIAHLLWLSLDDELCKHYFTKTVTAPSSTSVWSLL